MTCVVLCGASAAGSHLQGELPVAPRHARASASAQLRGPREDGPLRAGTRPAYLHICATTRPSSLADARVSCVVSYACRVVSCRVVSCRVVSCRVVSCRVVSCRARTHKCIDQEGGLASVHSCGSHVCHSGQGRPPALHQHPLRRAGTSLPSTTPPCFALRMRN
jgi:hypothetical protein